MLSEAVGKGTLGFYFQETVVRIDIGAEISASSYTKKAAN